MSTKITFNKVDLQYQTESLISTLIVNNGFDRKHRFTVEEGKEVSAKISKALEGNTILKPEEDLRYQDYYTKFSDIVDMYTLSILSHNFNRFSFSREDVEYEVANSIARAGKIVYRIVEKPVKPATKTKTSKSKEAELPEMREDVLPEVEGMTEEEVEKMITTELQKLMTNIDYDKISKLPEEQQWKEVAKAVCDTYPTLDKNKVEKLLSDVNSGKATDEQFENVFSDMLKNIVVKPEEPTEEEPSVDLPTLESIKDSWEDSVETFKHLLEINDVKCSYKVVKYLLKDYKKLLTVWDEEDSFNSILDAVNRKGVDFYQKLAESKSAKEDKETSKEETVVEEPVQEETEEVPEVEAEIVPEGEVNFPLVEEDLTKDDRQEVSGDGKPHLKYEEPSFNFKEGIKEDIKNFLEVAVKTDTKANCRRFINEKAAKWETAFNNYDNPEDITVYMVKDIKNFKEFSFIDNVEEAGLNNNTITNFLAAKFREQVKALDKSKAKLDEFQALAKLTEVVDAMILDEYKAK